MIERIVPQQEFVEPPNFVATSPLSFQVAPPLEVSGVLDADIDDLFSEIFEKSDEKYLLPGVGFSVKKQVKLLIDAYREVVVEGGVLEEVLPLWLERTKEDIELFCYEYPLGMYVFPNRLDLRQDETSEFSFYAPRYQRNLIETILPQEREGAVAKGVGSTEKLFGNLPQDSCVFLVSPLGKSGLMDDKGEEIEYLDTQIYIYLKDQTENLQAVTLRTDLSLEESERLVFGAAQEGKSVWERTVDVVKTPKTEMGTTQNFEDVVEILEKLTGRNYQHLYRELDKWSESQMLDSKVFARIKEFEDFAKQNISDLTPAQLRNLTIELGKTILDVYLIIKNKSMEKVPYNLPLKIILIFS